MLRIVSENYGCLYRNKDKIAENICKKLLK